MEGTFVVKDALTPQEVQALREKITQFEFADGQKTAGGMAKSVKNNLQLTAREAPDLIREVSQKLISNKGLQNVAMPRALVRVMVNLYRTGMAYGTHTDAAVIDGHRSDLSFTLFLSEPDTYQGGELALESPFGEKKVKLKPGSMLVYPTGVLHRVTELVSGERMAVVGWLQSRIRDPQKRQVILDIDGARRAYLDKVGHDRNADLMLKAGVNLRRMWDE